MQKFKWYSISELQIRTFAFKGRKHFNLFKISMLLEILLAIFVYVNFPVKIFYND